MQGKVKGETVEFNETRKRDHRVYCVYWAGREVLGAMVEVMSHNLWAGFRTGDAMVHGGAWWCIAVHGGAGCEAVPGMAWV